MLWWGLIYFSILFFIFITLLNTDLINTKTMMMTIAWPYSSRAKDVVRMKSLFVDVLGSYWLHHSQPSTHHGQANHSFEHLVLSNVEIHRNHSPLSCVIFVSSRRMNLIGFRHTAWLELLWLRWAGLGSSWCKCYLVWCSCCCRMMREKKLRALHATMIHHDRIGLISHSKFLRSHLLETYILLFWL